MKTKFQKTMNIASELLAYCHQHGAKEFHLDVMEGSGSVSLTMRASPEDVTDEQLEYLKTALSAPRQREVEQDYWELMGGSEGSSELTLLGMLCDESEVDYKNDTLTITIKRYD
ncbi:MAG: hypothetical protein FWB97_04070 [Oscillospiraceae bacterium]|nr:hypothetical protein [Oscillospiraceae bacterium]